MAEPNATDRTYRPLHLFFQVGLISVGFTAISVALASNPASAAIAVAAAAGLIASAFLGLPKALLRYTRERQGYRPNTESLFAIGGPLALGAAAAWMTINDVRDYAFISTFAAPPLTFIASPFIDGAICLMFLGVLVANIISLAHSRQDQG